MGSPSKNLSQRLGFLLGFFRLKRTPKNERSEWEFDNRGRAQELKLRARRKNIQSILLGVTTIKASTKAEAFIVVQREANGEFDNAALRTGVYSEHSARLYARRRYILLGVTKVKRPPKDGSLL